MNPIRREVLNGLFVLVISTLLSAAIAAFEIKFNLEIWVLIVMAVAIGVSGYVVFEITLGSIASTEDREKEWLKRVGTPARLELSREGGGADILAILESVKALSPGSDYTVMYYYGSEGGAEVPKDVYVVRETALSALLELPRRGTIREYKLIICFDQAVVANDPELRLGVLRVGEGPGTIDSTMGNHCRLMIETKGCSLYVAPAVVRTIVTFYGMEKVGINIYTAEQNAASSAPRGAIFFCDPPNGEIIERFRQMERATERRMVAVHKILFPEGTESTAKPATL